MRILVKSDDFLVRLYEESKINLGILPERESHFINLENENYEMGNP